VWTICFVDTVVSYDFFVLLCSELIFFSLSITLYCLPLVLVNKVNQFTLFFWVWLIAVTS